MMLTLISVGIIILTFFAKKCNVSVQICINGTERQKGGEENAADGRDI